ncbi:MAG TPA: GH92 family glycosyl hydrolase, partial [Chloroflexota bacterium]|nr:GH92 family glycosyl hydrolase [Chloroflexota bacterium]
LMAALFPAPSGARSDAGTGAQELNLLPSVDPFIGTGSGMPAYGLQNEGGHVFPGAAYPHGMVQWSPDTTEKAGGYRYVQSRIMGFSLTHFSGRGCAAYQDFPFMPALGSVTASPAVPARYAATYSHHGEVATPGYYHVQLGTGIAADLTVTPRTGLGRFTYPRSPAAVMLINAGGSATGDSDQGTGIQIAGANWVTGSATSGHFCGQGNTYTVYFAAQFNVPFSGFGTWNGAKVQAGSRSSSGSQSGAYLTFDTRQQRAVMVKVGISFVSVANARENLARENPGWSFDGIRQQVADSWNQALNVIQVSGGSPEQRTVFYTALYHTLFHPNIFSDANGQYLGFDQKVHIARGYVQYENFPGWDMYRSLIGLLALVNPGQTGDMLQSLVEDAAQGGGALPRWQVANDNSDGMVGDSQDVVIATAYALGIRHFDTRAALQAMDRGASDLTARSGRYAPREGLSDYLRLHYVPATLPGSASITLEYATDDFAIAQFAAALGDQPLYARYRQRALAWRNLWDAAAGAVEPRAADGSFPPRAGVTSTIGFVEGDSAQYTWMVPFDLPGLFARMGGETRAVQRLDRHFTQLNAGPVSPYAFMGNEPELVVPWIYDFAGAPSRTQAVTRRIELSLFHATVNGLPGNDDGGALSSWYIFAALGLYPAIPGVPGFVLGSPLFPGAVVHVAGGRILRIVAPTAGPDHPYVQSLVLDGQPYPRVWLPYSVIAQGATLQYTLSKTPRAAWGAAAVDAPPIFYRP